MDSYLAWANANCSDNGGYTYTYSLNGSCYFVDSGNEYPTGGAVCPLLTVGKEKGSTYTFSVEHAIPIGKHCGPLNALFSDQTRDCVCREGADLVRSGAR
jgi:hypothetical protein